MEVNALDLARVAQTNVALYRQMHDLGYAASALRLARDAYELVSVPFAGHYRACGKPFVCHLVGTASIMASLRVRPELVVAGLLHSAYETSLAFGNNVGSVRLTPARIRSALGDGVECLVAGYRDTPWNPVSIAVLANEALGPAGTRSELLLLRLANELDDHLDFAMAYCAGERRKIDATCDLWTQMADALGYPALGDALRTCIENADGADWAKALGSGRPMSYAPLEVKPVWLRRLVDLFGWRLQK